MGRIKIKSKIRSVGEGGKYFLGNPLTCVNRITSITV